MPLRRTLLCWLFALALVASSGLGVQASSSGVLLGEPAQGVAAGPAPQPVTPPAAPASPKRSDIPRQYTWDLESIYATDAAWEADFEAARAMIPRLESHRGKLGESAAQLLAFLKLQDEAGMKLDQLYVYASMRRDEDTGNSHYQDLAGRIETLASNEIRAVAFFTPEILALPEEQVRAYLDQEPGLQPYRHVLEDLIRQKPHVRSAEVEELLAQTREIARTSEDAYRVLTNADMKFPSIVDEEGQQVELTNANYGRFITSQDRRVRKDAWDAMTGTYRQFRNSLASTLAGSVRSDVFSAQVRNYQSSLQAAMAPDNLPVEVYTSLLQAVNDNLPLLHRYMAVRKRAMGVDELHMYDRYVPLVPDVDFKMSYDDAVKTVLASVAPLGPEYVEVARQGLASRWVDVYETEGKRSGGYAWGAYTTKPFILMNYEGTLDDVYTLAHELGHAMNFYYTRKSQPYASSNISIFAAETASNVNETLLTEYLLRTTTDPKVRAFLINKEVDSFQGGFFLQALYAEFELETHRRAEAGEALSAGVMSRIWRDLGTRYFGPDMVVDEGWATSWGRIPHFYNAYYVYQYCTGLAGASALAQQILAGGQPAAQRYLEFLKSGGSDYPLELLRKAGVDMASPEPVEKAIARFGQLLDRLEASLP